MINGKKSGACAGLLRKSATFGPTQRRKQTTSAKHISYKKKSNVQKNKRALGARPRYLPFAKYTPLKKCMVSNVLLGVIQMDPMYY